jgi:hypothetical protein
MVTWILFFDQNNLHCPTAIEASQTLRFMQMCCRLISCHAMPFGIFDHQHNGTTKPFDGRLLPHKKNRRFFRFSAVVRRFATTNTNKMGKTRGKGAALEGGPTRPEV